MPWFIYTLLSLFVVTIIIVLSPRYLRYADRIESADVIVLFIGPEEVQRRAKAIALLRAGYADTLYIPAHRAIFTRPGEGDAERVIIRTTDRESWLERNKLRLYPRYFEETHLEVLMARDFMHKKDLRKAIFVSSPYHIRRIRSIAASVIPGHEAQVQLVPFGVQERFSPFWFLDRNEVKWVCSEYVKLCWFWLYSFAEKIYRHP